MNLKTAERGYFGTFCWLGVSGRLIGRDSRALLCCILVYLFYTLKQAQRTKNAGCCAGCFGRFHNPGGPANASGAGHDLLPAAGHCGIRAMHGVVES